MEIKAELLKPYTEEERLDFTCEHQYNTEFVETETELQVWGYTDEELAQQKHARIQELYMTRSDFFDSTIQAWGVGQDELLELIQRLLSVMQLPDVQKLIAINNFKNALNFYRKHDLFKILVSMPIQLSEEIKAVITVTDEHLDRFFDEVAKGNKATAWQELPQPVPIPVEETEKPHTLEDESNVNS